MWTGANGGTKRRAPRSKGQMTKRTSPFLPNFACGQTRACPEQTGEGRRELLPPGDLLSLFAQRGFVGATESSGEICGDESRGAVADVWVVLATVRDQDSDLWQGREPPQVEIPFRGSPRPCHGSRFRLVAARACGSPRMVALRKAALMGDAHAPSFHRFEKSPHCR